MSIFTSTAAYYHQTPVNGDASTNWAAGGPRKGVADGQREIGVVLFDKAAIKAAIGNSNVPDVTLLLYRDSAYGTGTVDISIAPIMTQPALNSMTYNECLALARRNNHYQTTVSGANTTIHLPGYWLQLIRMNGIAGILIYQEVGEGTQNYARFTSTAILTVTIGTSWATPVWMRPIGTGDIISDETHSLMSDMLEMMEYINIRREMHGLSWIGYSGLSPSAYADWPAATLVFQNGINGIYTAESKTAISWTRAGANDLPNAAIINQIRNALEAPVSGGGGAAQTVAVPSTNYARTYFDHYGSDFTVNLNEKTTWAGGRAPMSGMNWEYTTERGTKEKKYNRRFGFWLLAGLVNWSNVSTAKLRLTRNEGNSGTFPITLYPVKIASLPSEKKTVNEVFQNQTTVCGTASAAVGQTVDIELTAAMIAALAAGTYTGVGVNDHDNWTNFGASATLITT